MKGGNFVLKQTQKISAPVVDDDDQQRVPLVEEDDVTTSNETIKVIAPADLSEGYTFNTKLNDGSERIVKVAVPSGGILKGQTFDVDIGVTTNSSSDDMRGVSSHIITIPTAVDGDDIDIPVGHWKDGLCNCLSVGLIHPMLCNAYLCPLVLTAQIMHRLKLNWIACPVHSSSTTSTKGHHPHELKTFQIVVSFYGFVIVLNIIMALILGRVSHNIENNTGEESYYNANTGELVLNPVLLMSLQVVQCFNYITALYSLWIMIRTRYLLRKKYMIPTSVLPCCPGCAEDCCTIYFCNCCTLSQMARHTANYDHYPATCCTETGIKRSMNR